jgi:hypothetical protein
VNRALDILGAVTAVPVNAVRAVGSLKVGTRVQSKFGRPLIGTIERANPTGDFWVRWDDGSASSMNASDLKVIKAAPSAVEQKAAVDETMGRLKKWGVTSAAPSLVAAVVGAVVWKQHRVLGFLGGAAAGANAYALATGDNGVYGRGPAAGLMAAAGAGVGLSLYWKKHSFWGYVLGHMGASTVVSFVPGMGEGAIAKSFQTDSTKQHMLTGVGR